MSDPAIFMLREGRRLGYAEYGTPNGRPLLFFHATPGSHVQLASLDTHARRVGLRIIVPERPGYGRSDPLPGYALLDVACDAVELAESLGIDRFGTAGVSGGGPYALAVAAQSPDRVTCVGLISSIGPTTDGEPFDRAALETSYRPVAERARRDPEGLVDELIAGAAERDRPALTQSRDMIIASFYEAYRQGVIGIVDDMAAHRRPWGFDLPQIAMPVYLWHGDADPLVPISVAYHLAALLPACAPIYLEDQTHFLPDEVFLPIFTRLADVMVGATEA
ncbi:MAG: alpha/beta fold hydrolase [Chloroflexi bacterium]|nr:alpha/beta fold hydrolase [Chloroflexota bacterium]